jgi:CPA2 family monovalent cation:H+ antiporter-2
MPHDTPLITTIVAGLSLAFVLGTLAQRLRIPPLVGYLLAGVLIGPHTPGFVVDQGLASELAEMGVVLLMFGVGLHFSLKDLLSVRGIAVPGALAQIVIATALGAALGWAMGWPLGAGLTFGLALSVASTVVLLRALQERRLVETERGRIAVGWLIVEDIAMVMALVLLPPLAGLLGGEATSPDGQPLVAATGLGLAGIIAITFGKVAAFVAFMLIVGRRVIPWVLHYVAHTGSRELFRLAVLVIALGVAFGAAKLFDVSLALGAFFAGMILSESELSHRAAEESLPFRDAFAVLFFVSVGMLFEPESLITEPLPVLATLLIIVVGKSLVAYFIVRAFKHPPGTALMISASLAQIGEFSFILAGLGMELQLLPKEGRDLILAGAILSILVNPAAFAFEEWLKRRNDRRAAQAAVPAEPKPESSPPPGQEWSGHAVIVGYGRVGSLVGAALRENGTRFRVIEDSDRMVAQLQAEGIDAIAGNSARGDVLRSVALPTARQLIVAIPNAFEAGQVIQQARAVNPKLQIVARAHSDAEVEHLTRLGADVVIMGEREIAREMIKALADGPAPAEH